MKIIVPVVFSGTVDVEVPDHLHPKDAIRLASTIALARIVAVTDNPDAPEEQAFDEYQEEASPAAQATADEDWEKAKITGVGGTWENSAKITGFGD